VVNSLSFSSFSLPFFFSAFICFKLFFYFFSSTCCAPHPSKDFLFPFSPDPSDTPSFSFHLSPPPSHFLVCLSAFFFALELSLFPWSVFGLSPPPSDLPAQFYPRTLFIRTLHVCDFLTTRVNLPPPPSSTHCLLFFSVPFAFCPPCIVFKVREFHFF